MIEERFCKVISKMQGRTRPQVRLGEGEPHNTREFSNIVAGAFTPVLAKHTKSFNLIDTLSVGVDRIQRNFEPLQRQVETWRQTQITLHLIFEGIPPVSLHD